MSSWYDWTETFLKEPDVKIRQQLATCEAQVLFEVLWINNVSILTFIWIFLKQMLSNNHAKCNDLWKKRKERSLFCSPRLNLFDQKYSTNFEILLQFKINVFYVNICSKAIFFPVIKLYFQHHYSSLQCHMIFRNHYNMLICCLRNISDHNRCWKQLCC